MFTRQGGCTLGTLVLPTPSRDQLALFFSGTAWIANHYEDRNLPGLVVLGCVCFGLCLWRGIVAIRQRKVKTVTDSNFGIWMGIFISSFISLRLVLSDL
jgi:hypothetical protein